MPIRTHRGRAAVYRRLWGWPLRSPRHLVVAVLGFAVLATGVGLVLPEYSGSDTPAPTTVVAPSTKVTISIGPGASAERRTPRVTTSLPQAAPPPAAPAPEALTVAENWAKGWVNHPAGMTTEQWLEQLRPYTTEEYLTVMGTVDPANVPATKVTGRATALEATASSVQVTLPTDAGDLQILVIASPSGWRVAGYTKAS
ncbi:hypothetical protein GCM10012275_38870 [Longimycelium tulufanense]|uniref:Uncharacterized protein n=1 Tax=Longimycelium tulufanense TaxID=907463 RepID=A0A8J3CAE7_9PSEU|nr:hypothetical protein [Longimycelium tulufanense]GGM64496.1 hypothetical protein GCM10012275_38870 [Longimycelium tulufanense]